MKGLLVGAIVDVFGYVSKVAEMSCSPKGQFVTKFDVGVGQKEKGTDVFYHCVVWEPDAEMVGERLLQKGMAVFVRGWLKVQRYKSKTDTVQVSHDVTVRKLGIFKSPDDIEWLELKGELRGRDYGTGKESEEATDKVAPGGC